MEKILKFLSSRLRKYYLILIYLKSKVNAESLIQNKLLYKIFKTITNTFYFNTMVLKTLRENKNKLKAHLEIKRKKRNLRCML